MSRRPFFDKADRVARQAAFDDLAGGDGDIRFELAVSGMEMRRRVLSNVHGGCRCHRNRKSSANANPWITAAADLLSRRPMPMKVKPRLGKLFPRLCFRPKPPLSLPPGRRLEEGP